MAFTSSQFENSQKLQKAPKEYDFYFENL